MNIEERNPFDVDIQRRRTNNVKRVKTRQKKQTKHTSENNENFIAGRQYSKYLYLLTSVNTIYCRNKYFGRQIVNKKRICFSQKTPPSQIRMLLPGIGEKEYDTINETLARHISTYFDWFMYCIELHHGLNMLTTSPTNFPLLFSTPYYMNYMRNVQIIYYKNQRFRWHMKSLVNRWLLQRSMKRLIGGDSDIITFESIPLEKQIRIACFSTRSVYVFTGNTLLRSVCSNLETQLHSIPNVKQPVNPFSNTVFGYGQLTEIYNVCLQWCAQHKKKIPLLLSMYRNSHFCVKHLMNMYYSDIQLRATRNYMKHNDHELYIFFENLESIMYSYSRIYNKDIAAFSKHMFTIWFEMDPQNDLHVQWKSFLTDYWYYEQTRICCRPTWITPNSIFLDLETLMNVSRPQIFNALKEHRKKRKNQT